MKSSILIILFFCCISAFAQTPDYENIPLGNAANCKAAASVALEASKYVLSKPFDSQDAVRYR